MKTDNKHPSAPNLRNFSQTGLLVFDGSIEVVLGTSPRQQFNVDSNGR